MLHPHLLLTPTEGMPRQDWLQLRQQSIGGSDIGVIMGLNPYMSKRELFYRFVESEGNMQKQHNNLSMLLGHDLEPVVANLWEHWGGDEASLVANKDAGTKVSECVVLPYHIKNPAALHLHANVDRGMVRNHQGRRGILELKTIASLAADKYEGGLPVSYITQVQHYMLVCEEEYAEIAMLKDGRNLEVFPIERDDDLISRMVDLADEFWRQVTEARRIWADKSMSPARVRHAISDIEPETDDTPAFEQFLRKRWQSGGNPDVLLKGTDEDLLLLDGYQQACADLKTHEGRQQHFKNALLARLESQGADVLMLADGSKVTFRADRNGKRVFRASSKIK